VNRKLNRWAAQFPFLANLTEEDFARIADAIHFAALKPGEIAYQEEWECPNYIMCVDGRTRIYKTNTGARGSHLQG
jgi:CRP/FNR family transcriptional regulator